jgi:hypothetical protein
MHFFFNIKINDWHMLSNNIYRHIKKRPSEKNEYMDRYMKVLSINTIQKKGEFYRK